jgi:hypothetical protein
LLCCLTLALIPCHRAKVIKRHPPNQQEKPSGARLFERATQISHNIFLEHD